MESHSNIESGEWDLTINNGDIICFLQVFKLYRRDLMGTMGDYGNQQYGDTMG